MMSFTPKGLLFVFVGPGGAGKNALMNTIKQRYSFIRQLATATTRPIRPDEQQGREHQFVTPEQFRDMIANDLLLEYQEVTPDRYYGIPRATVENHLNSGQNLVADIEVIGARILRDSYPDDVRLIFVTVPGDTTEEQLDILRQRMEARNEDEQIIAHRLDRARQLELPFISDCDYIIKNDDIESAALELENIILGEIRRRKETTTPEEA